MTTHEQRMALYRMQVADRDATVRFLTFLADREEETLAWCCGPMAAEVERKVETLRAAAGHAERHIVGTLYRAELLQSTWTTPVTVPLD
jgi:hypothetical protein